ncbi:hypothetical protein SRB5_62880 [Streptomyces sp. RB5]|uniref:Alpha/beta hydrolase n=1 Tax=Streptomyces smaragdinus TaxID=2585196 RepID=A0A7K0CRI1_9ACTN|nr:alpha/beta fold hydrolase [Streptomyces smaragdinus]MQY16096.1 hypothetical protein [Streptomyces smaragdinus]
MRVSLRPLLAGVLLALSACGTTPPPPAFEPPPAATGEWWPCPLTGMARRECTRVTVPVGPPHAESISLAVTRLPARRPARRIGALVLLPGGPGLSGLQEALAATVEYPPALRDRFDIVGVDMRGVGRSSPVDCGEPIGPLDGLRDAPDLSAADVDAVDAQVRDYVEYCRIQHGELIGRLGSRVLVRDLEAVREALGEERISLLAHSYGTLPGQLYLASHPDRVRSAVFDGVLDPARSGPAMALRTVHSREELDAEQVPVPQSRRIPADVRAAFRELAPGGPSLALFLGRHCADFTWPSSVGGLLRWLESRSGEPRWRLNTVARDYAACVHWPEHEPPPPGAVWPAGGGVRPLLIGSEGDIRTPLAGAERVAERFDAPLVTVGGGRHGLVGHGSACAERAAVAYLSGRSGLGAGDRVRC